MTDERDEGRRRLEGYFRDELAAAAVESPSYEELVAYVEGRLAAAERAELEERIAGDDVVRREVELLRELHDQMTRPAKAAPPRRSRTWAALAAAASIAAVATWLAVKPGPPPGGGTPGTTPSAAPLAALSDGGERIVLSADGAVGGLPGVAPDLRDAAAAALRGALPVGPDLSRLRGGTSSLMGGREGRPSLAPERPVGTRVASPRPTFRWTRLPGATTYDVRVFDQDLREQATGRGLAGTEWQPARPIAPGGVYLWQVTAHTPRGPVIAPAPPQPEARFEVADDALVARVARRRQGAPGSHLVALIAFVEAGLLDDAESELQVLATENPGAPEVQRLRDRLGAMR